MTKYMNKKTGRIYRLLGRAIDHTNSRTGTEVIIYCLDIDSPHVQTLVREEYEFFEKFIELK